MKILLTIGLVFLLASLVNAETYSWEDENGTYNFTEDFSKVPKKYQKNVRRLGDMQETEAPPAALSSEKVADQPDKAAEKSQAVAADGKVLYDGKSFDTWRKDLNVLETELKSLEQRQEELRKQIYETKGNTKAEFDALKREHDDGRAVYEQKYKDYLTVIDAARKAGISVDMKK